MPRVAVICGLAFYVQPHPPPPLSVVDGRDRVLVCQPVKQPGEGRIHQVSHIQVKKYKSLVLKEVKEYKVYQSTNTPGKFLKSSQRVLHGSVARCFGVHQI